MPRYYVDLDNNKLLTGPATTQLAATPRLYQGDKPVLDVELLTRENGVLAYYTSTASAINVRVGTLGGTAVASALTLSTVTLSAAATATAGIVSPVTATGAATLLGSVTATATVGINSPSVVTITPTVTTFTTAKCVAYLGQEAVEPSLRLSLTPNYDKYIEVVEAGTPYPQSASVYGTVLTTNQTSADLLLFAVPNNGVDLRTFSGIFRSVSSLIFSVSTVMEVTSAGALVSSTPSASLLTAQCEFLTTNGAFVSIASVTSMNQINLKLASYARDSGASYFSTLHTTTTAYYYFHIASTTVTLTYANALGTAVTGGWTGTQDVWIRPVRVISNTQGLINSSSASFDANAYSGLEYTVRSNMNSAFQSGDGTIPKFATSIYASAPDAFTYPTVVSPSGEINNYSGENVVLQFEALANGDKEISGGYVEVSNYLHRPQLALSKTVPVTVYPSKAYPGRRVESVEVISCGSMYASTPSVIFSEPEDENGITARGVASLQSGKLSGVTITEKGSGYTNPPDVFVLPDVRLLKSAAARSVTSVVTYGTRTVSLALGSGTTMADNSWAILNGLGVANGLAYVVTVLSSGSQITCKLLQNAAQVTATSGASVTPLIPYTRVTGATISGTDSNFAVGTTIPVAFTTPSCGDTDAVAMLSVQNSGQVVLASIPTPGYATAFSVATISAYRKLTGLTVTCAGSGYWSSLPAITVDSSSYVATAPGATPAVISAGLNGNGSLSLSIACAGYGYTSAPTITIAPPNGGDGIRIVTLATRGVGYSDGTFSCTVSAPPSGGAQAVVNFVKSGTSQGFVVVNPGRGYTSTPLVTVPTPDLGGQVSGFTVTCAGAGYADAPQIVFSGGGGTGASATAILANGSVTSISLTAAGSGYTSAPSLTLQSPDTSVYYSKQIDMSVAGVTTLLGGNSSASAYLQVEEKRGADTTVLAQVPITVIARVS